MVGKAEYLPGKENQRFVVTSIPPWLVPAQVLYEQIYCARGNMENRIKEQQLDMFADRTSSETMRANQIHLWFSALAYCLVQRLRVIGLKGTDMQSAQCGTIRNGLFKIGARISVTARKIWLHCSTAYPFKETFEAVLRNLRSYPSEKRNKRNKNSNTKRPLIWRPTGRGRNYRHGINFYNQHFSPSEPLYGGVFSLQHATTRDFCL